MKVTPFQQRVYDAVSRIPRGKVATYAEIAACLGCGSPRAVGQALKKNPFAPRVPCHRVIAANLTIGGFQGKIAGAAIRRKLQLLEGEGVRFAKGRLDESIRR
jgi:methylated-DNA-[protein]-cysteine S-methyltransferase